MIYYGRKVRKRTRTMPPKGSRQAFTPAQATANGNSLMSRWFTPATQPRKPGRPCLPFKKFRGRGLGPRRELKKCSAGKKKGVAIAIP